MIQEFSHELLPAPFYSLMGACRISNTWVDSPLGDRGERGNDLIVTLLRTSKIITI